MGVNTIMRIKMKRFTIEKSVDNQYIVILHKSVMIGTIRYKPIVKHKTKFIVSLINYFRLGEE